MILYSDSLIELVYDVKSDILRVRWPDIKDIPVSVIENSFSQLITKINHYQVAKLLIDSRNSVILMPDEEYKRIVFKLSQDLATTSLKKIARILSLDQYREAKLKVYSEEISAKLTFQMESKEFSTEEEAISWLSE